MENKRNRRNYSGLQLNQIEPQERLFYFLRFESVCELEGKALFHSLKELAVYFLIWIGKKPTLKAINSTTTLLRYRIGVRKIKEIENIQKFKEELFGIAFQKAQIVCGNKNDSDCQKCPLKNSFKDRFNRGFHAVYPELEKKATD